MPDLPAVRILAGDDLKDLFCATVVLCRRGANGHYGFLMHDNLESLDHTCGVLSRRIGHSVSANIIREAYWQCARSRGSVFSVSAWCIQACLIALKSTLDDMTSRDELL